MTFNANRRKSAKPMRPDDFVWRPLRPKQKQTPEEMETILKNAMKLNGR